MKKDILPIGTTLGKRRVRHAFVLLLLSVMVQAADATSIIPITMIDPMVYGQSISDAANSKKQIYIERGFILRKEETIYNSITTSDSNISSIVMHFEYRNHELPGLIGHITYKIDIIKEKNGICNPCKISVPEHEIKPDPRTYNKTTDDIFVKFRQIMEGKPEPDRKDDSNDDRQE